MNEAKEMNLTVRLPQGIEHDAKKVLILAQAYVIADPLTYRLAADERKDINVRIAAMEAKRREIVDPLNKAVKAVNDLFRRPIEILTQARGALDNAILAYDEEQERIRREAEEKARHEQEEAQRKAREAEEKARREAEEAARKAQEAKDEEARRRAEQEAAAAAQRAEEAAAQRTELDHAPAPIVAPATPRVAGVSTRTNWKGECNDFNAMVMAVAAPLILNWMRQHKKQTLTIEDVQAFGQAPITLVKIDDTVLNQMARAMKEALTIPGCRAVAEKGVASSRRSA